MAAATSVDHRGQLHALPELPGGVRDLVHDLSRLWVGARSRALSSPERRPRRSSPAAWKSSSVVKTRRRDRSADSPSRRSRSCSSRWSRRTSMPSSPRSTRRRSARSGGSRATMAGCAIVVHASNLIDAQAVLVEFTGDVGLVDDIAVDPDQEGPASDMAVVTWSRLQDVGVQANRLRAGGVDVRIELPGEEERASAEPRRRSWFPSRSWISPGRSWASSSERGRDPTSRRRGARGRPCRLRGGRMLRPSLLGERPGGPVRTARPRLPQSALLPLRVDRVPYRTTVTSR